MPDYQNGKIYKITGTTDEGEELIYIGSTVQKLCVRFAGHKRYLKNDENMSSKQVVSCSNCLITLIELFPCNTKEELLMRERHYYDLYDCVNKYKPIYFEGEVKEYKNQYYIKNADKLKEKTKQYRIENIDKIKEYKKQYRIENADKIKEHDKQYYIKNIDKRKEHDIENADKIKEYKKQYRIENADKLKEINKQWRILNSNKKKETAKQYYIENADKLKEYQKQFRLRKKELKLMGLEDKRII
jgi:hypothetical protein